MPTIENLTKLAVPAAILFAIYKFVPNQAAKAMALGVGGVLIAKQLPVLGAAVDA
jgi:hypothetical protein